MKSRKNRAIAQFEIQNVSDDPFVITVGGRVLWALDCLIAAGAKGCTPIDTPGPRWSDYVFKLRGEGVDVETIHEAHGGQFPGSHARYVLRSKARRLDDEELAA